MLKSDAKDLDNSAAEQVKRIVDHSDMEGAGKMYVEQGRSPSRDQHLEAQQVEFKIRLNASLR
ncbi:hypothetical protein A3711_00740 [Erythrobacter sp. HI00D59]|nr:hypothetical protein A3711_00740 [Erythrobacter sp. HI00D59]